MDLKQFLAWEQASRDTIDVKKIYVDMAGDLVAGVLLSQIVFWFLPNKKGKSKLRVRKQDVLWLAKGRDDWWDECRISARQFDTAVKKLTDKKLIEKKVMKFNGETKIHVRILWESFLSELTRQLNQQEEGTDDDPEGHDNGYEGEEGLDAIEIYKSVNPDLHKETRIYKSVNPDSPIRKSRMHDFVNPLTERTTEIKDNLYESNAPSWSYNWLEE